LIILGINAYHPDASVALLKAGVLFWAGEEERYNRVKHSSGFPRFALQHCLQETKISPSDIDVVALSKDPKANFLRKALFILKYNPRPKLLWDRLKAFGKSSHFKKDFMEALNISESSLKAKFVHVEHHKAHVASSFFLSGFDRAAFLSLDGMGDFSSAMWGIGDGNKLHVLNRVYFPHSAGFLYTAGTQFLGFLNFGDEYKVMGLAAYGKPIYLDLFRRMVHFKEDGRFELNLDYFVHHKGQAKIRWEGGAPEQDILYSEQWFDLFGNPRRSQEEVSERHQNLAASLQAVLEEIYFHVLNHLYYKTKEKNLCLAGGVVFNGVANGKIRACTPFKNVYIQPAAGDAGTALGAATFFYHSVMKQPRMFTMNHVFFGSDAHDEEIKQAMHERNLYFQKLSEEDLIQKTAQALRQGQIVGWFQGRMEFGPRALGNRSLLADPRRQDMQKILNERIKHRENFRPFAPAIPEEDVHEYFEVNGAFSPFMLEVFPVKTSKRSIIPAVTHVNGTARVQTVSEKEHPRFWKLLKEFGKITGVPVLLNTSFNENEPIVCTPKEALACYLKTQTDVLVMGDYFLAKNDPIT